MAFTTAQIKRRYRLRHPDRIAAERRAYAKRVQLFKRTLKDRPCVDCKRRYPYYVMQFDHVRGKKALTIGRTRHVSFTKIEAEMTKCVVVCANCHAIRTYKRTKKNVKKHP